MMFVLSIVGLLLTLACFVGAPIVLGLVIVEVFLSIQAAMAAKNGQFYRYPVNIRLIQ